ncbi:MAG: hypothetical protein Q7S79_00730 [bacterium]|nr:hypothetical protein [bacterium]
MAEEGVELLDKPPVVESAKQKEFSMDVEIDGLPYIFKGTVPDNPEGIILSLHVPNWEKELDKIRKKIASGEMFPGPEVNTFRLYQGRIGFINLTPHDKPAADLHIERIRSNTWIVPKDSPYYDVHGLGRFLMNNMLTLADVKGWSIEGSPYTDGRLTDEHVYSWLQRKGFKDNKKGELVRQPQKPDTTQSIYVCLSATEEAP